MLHSCQGPSSAARSLPDLPHLGAPGLASADHIRLVCQVHQRAHHHLRVHLPRRAGASPGRRGLRGHVMRIAQKHDSTHGAAACIKSLRPCCAAARTVRCVLANTPMPASMSLISRHESLRGHTGRVPCCTAALPSQKRHLQRMHAAYISMRADHRDLQATVRLVRGTLKQLCEDHLRRKVLQSRGWPWGWCALAAYFRDVCSAAVALADDAGGRARPLALHLPWTRQPPL